MALNFNPIIPHSHSSLLLFTILSVSHTSLIPLCHSQSSPSPQNIETFYPIQPPTPSPSPYSPSEQLGTPPPPAAVSKTSTNGKIAKAVAATAAATLVVSGLIFLLVERCLRSRRREEAVVVPQSSNNGFERIEGNVRGLIVDEDGLDVVYWRKIQGRNSSRMGLRKEIFRRSKKKEHQQEEEGGDDEEEDDEGKKGKKSESVQEFPLLRGKSSTSHINIAPEEDESNRITRKNKAEHLPPPPAAPKSVRRSPAPPPHPAPSLKSHETPATTGGKRGNSSGESTSESSNGHVKLKPLQRDKANTSNAADQSSFGFDQDLMEALFGYVATRKSPKGKTDSVNLNKDSSVSG